MQANLQSKVEELLGNINALQHEAKAAEKAAAATVEELSGQLGRLQETITTLRSDDVASRAAHHATIADLETKFVAMEAETEVH